MGDNMLSDLKQTMNDRMKNPFLFSFICSWIAWNWLLVYQVFTIDSNFTYYQRIKLISDYISKHGMDNLTIYPLLSSLGIAIVYLLGSGIFIFIFNFFNTTVKAWLNKNSLKGDIIPIDYFRMLEKKHEKLKKDSSQYLAENLSYIQQISDAKLENTKLENENLKLENQLQSAETDLEVLDLEYKELEEESNKLKTLKISENGIKTFFIGERTYFINVEQTKNNWVPQNLTDRKLVRISETDGGVVMVYDINNSRNIYELENLRASVDGRLISFELKDVLNKNTKFQFYLLRKGQILFRGYCVKDDDDVNCTIAISEI